MKNNKEGMMAAIVCVLAGIIALLSLVLFAVNAGTAETLPSPDAALTGDLRLSEAPMDLYVVECLRVDVASMSADGAWADLTLPYVPPSSIFGVILFDGYHAIHGVFTQTEENTLRVLFWREDVSSLDGTVGIYLVILAENEGVMGYEAD